MATFFACSYFILLGPGKIKGVILLDNLFMETALDNPYELHVIK
jgi:hypothetical protein